MWSPNRRHVIAISAAQQQKHILSLSFVISEKEWKPLLLVGECSRRHFRRWCLRRRRLPSSAGQAGHLHPFPGGKVCCWTYLYFTSHGHRSKWRPVCQHGAWLAWSLEPCIHASFIYVDLEMVQKGYLLTQIIIRPTVTNLIAASGLMRPAASQWRHCRRRCSRKPIELGYEVGRRGWVS